MKYVVGFNVKRSTEDNLSTSGPLLNTTVTPNETSYTLEGLQAGALYFVAVAASTSVGLGSFVNFTIQTGG